MQGIKFNEQGIKGILNGSKTMTRRPIKVRTDINKQAWIDTLIDDYSKYKVGEVLFVQEEFLSINGDIHYKIENSDYKLAWMQPSEMTEYQSRIKIKITRIKVERLQDISEYDCIKEGVFKKDVQFWESRGGEYPPQPKQDWAFTVDGKRGSTDAINIFKEQIWNKLPYQKPYDFDSNPYVFVYEFEVQ